jgi:hypothetical protein
MDQFSLRLQIIPSGSPRIIDNIDFESVALILFDPESPLDAFLSANDAMVFGDELMNSLKGSGRYLIFVNASGIADDGGWSGVDVLHDKDTIQWTFEVDDRHYFYCFDELSYRSQVKRIGAEIAQLPSGIVLEPSQVMFPEDW